MKSSEQVGSVPDDVVEKLVALARDAGVTYLALFGSAARGEMTDDSDIDLAIRFGGPYSLFDLGGLQVAMEQAAGRSIDLVPIDDAYSCVRISMERDLIDLYETVR